jgi:hypothetical protein
MYTRYFALIIGVVYTLVGVLGFIPGAHPKPSNAIGGVFDGGYGYLLGLFPINVLHNIVHILIGLAGIAAYRAYDTAKQYARGLAVLYIALAILGLIPGLNKVFGLIPIFGHDIWLHALTALVAAYFGFIHKDADTVSGRTAGATGR